MRSITFSIPAYNDELSIQELINNFQNSGFDTKRFRYLIIDDGSHDNTYAVSKELTMKYPNIDIFSNEQNRGFGYTIKSCLTTPTSDLILFIPGDYQFREDAATLLIDA